jgi:hypothetical protein
MEHDFLGGLRDVVFSELKKPEILPMLRGQRRTIK